MCYWVSLLEWCGNAFFSPLTTQAVILYPIKAVEFDPSCLGVHRECGWDVPGVTWGELEHTSYRVWHSYSFMGAMAESKAFAGLVEISWSVLFSPLTLTFLLGILASDLLVSLLSSLPHVCSSYHRVSDFSVSSLLMQPH